MPIFPSICGATAPTSSRTSTSDSPGRSYRGRSPRTSPGTATGTSTPSSTERCPFARRRRVQTFPDWFRFAGHPTAQFRQIGNAVPPALARAIGESIARGLRRKGRAEDASLREELVAWHRNGNRLPLPWRSSFDPWLILVSELLLGRTPSRSHWACLRRASCNRSRSRDYFLKSAMGPWEAQGDGNGRQG